MVLFLIAAAVSALVGCIVALLAADPRRKVRAPRGAQHRVGLSFRHWLWLHSRAAGGGPPAQGAVKRQVAFGLQHGPRVGKRGFPGNMAGRAAGFVMNPANA